MLTPASVAVPGTSTPGHLTYPVPTRAGCPPEPPMASQGQGPPPGGSGHCWDIAQGCRVPPATCRPGSDDDAKGGGWQSAGKGEPKLSPIP